MCVPIILSKSSDSDTSSAMTATQARLADTIDTFYGAADRNSDGAMAANAYRRAVEELDGGIGRELVRPFLPYDA